MTKRYTSTHWGIYEVLQASEGPRLAPFFADPDPSPIGLGMLEASHELRVARPSVRRSVLEAGLGAHPERRGNEPFVEVDWDTGLDLAASALREVIRRGGNEAVFGGSYGWSSAGRFHHAQSQVHRFLNSIGGYVRHVDSYSLGAARVVMPHIVAGMDELMAQHTSWDVLRAHTRLFITFGGVPRKNAQVNPGGAAEHRVRAGLAAMAEAGTRFVNISPVASDLDTGREFTWLPVRPNTDTALMLGMAHTLATENLHDRSFLERYCAGYAHFERYLLGADDGQPKHADWAAGICGVPAATIRQLARDAAAARTMLNISWSLQRSDHGEQPFWMLVTLAAMLGQIGLPGGGFGVGYGASNLMGMDHPRFSGPTLPQGQNAVRAFIPVARLADMLENPGGAFTYNGSTHRYPAIELIYWAGGNPFHHHQDLQRLAAAWRRVPHVIVNEPFWTPTARMADIVFPATTTLEREDIGFATRERYMIAMHPVQPPHAEARDDYAIFTGLAERLGAGAAFTEGRSVRDWLRHLYDDCRPRAARVGVELPEFDSFFAAGIFDIGERARPVVMLEDFRRDPAAHPLRTPSGRIEIHSERVAGFGYADCPGHPVWLAPEEWLGSAKAERYPLHMLSDQPHTKLHSQYDHARLSRENRIHGREPILMHPADAAARGIGEHDLVRVHNARGSTLAAAVLSERIARGVVKLSTGAWYDPGPDGLEKHGNPNALTLDRGASSLSQGCIAQTCLVDVERWTGQAPPVTAFDMPDIVARNTSR
ncbi:molybdopterin-dependent oxidoreductase [Verticiella sediminum]|uniref:Molybdopterin-dependent oxidoreductase n=1 Tax=Verticiella sediminum TaxID=1247510 RepID=A0A556AU12_9BURK|nr:molybdopterin-dependent oxidoreductase [Verticiella sediminum]TSH96438.1 molybdopterin-dependent oxidoreductase [Verticiella sediminum]